MGRGLTVKRQLIERRYSGLISRWVYTYAQHPEHSLPLLWLAQPRYLLPARGGKARDGKRGWLAHRPRKDEQSYERSESKQARRYLAGCLASTLAKSALLAVAGIFLVGRIDSARLRSAPRTYLDLITQVARARVSYIYNEAAQPKDLGRVRARSKRRVKLTGD